MGNVSSVQKGLNKINIPSIITNDEKEIADCSHIILPGVGSFKVAMDNLHARNLVSILKKEVQEKKKPLLGICLGMQLLAESGLEDEETEGLGFIEGQVQLIPDHDLPIPHIGWNEITIKKDRHFENVKDHNFYFVHSYWLNAKNPEDVAATVDYGTEITAAVQKNNIFGTQFHPEKSQLEGICILKNFLTSN